MRSGPLHSRASGVGARCAAALVVTGLLSSACAGSLAASSGTDSRNPFVETDQRLQLKPAMDRVGDIVGQEGSVRFLEFRDSVPEPLPGVAVGIDAFAFEDSRVLNKEWAAFTSVEGKWYGVLDSSLAPRERRLLILSSEDVAKSWRIAGTVERPLFLGAVDRLQFVSRDRGCLLVSRDDTDPGTPTVAFQSCTSDGGRTWSAFEQATSVQ